MAIRAAKPKARKIHIALPEEVHQRLRIKCAIADVSIQDFVARLLAESVKDVRLPAPKTHK